MDGDSSFYGCLDCGETSTGDGWNCQHCGSTNVTSNLQAARRVKEELAAKLRLRAQPATA